MHLLRNLLDDQVEQIGDGGNLVRVLRVRALESREECGKVLDVGLRAVVLLDDLGDCGQYSDYILVELRAGSEISNYE